MHVGHNGFEWNIRIIGDNHSELEDPCFVDDVDTTSIFVEVLGQTYSRGIQENVVRELDLQSSPGQPLAVRLVRQAIAMAEASQQALQGVDFMTQLTFSAAAHATGFVDTCHTLGISPHAFSAQQRAAIDACVRQRFANAARHGQSPVAPGGVRRWLHAELAAIHAQKPDPR